MAFPELGMVDTTKSETLADLGEEEVVERLVGKLRAGRRVVVGPGDDCAVIESDSGEWQLLKTDCLVEGVHFESGTDFELVGRKAMNRVLSDIAAMGGTPRHALVTVASHAARSVAELEGWYDGMVAAGEGFDCQIVGGETTRLPDAGAVISVAMTGVVEPGNCVLRSGASVGDVIAVTGRLGGSLASGRHLSFSPRIAESRWLVENYKPTAMMDLSDGLGSVLPRLAESSAVGYTCDRSRIPVHDDSDTGGAISDGEDYELLMTFPPDSVEGLMEGWNTVFPDLPLTIIGEISKDTPDPLNHGWEHYRNS